MSNTKKIKRLRKCKDMQEIGATRKFWKEFLKIGKFRCLSEKTDKRTYVENAVKATYKFIQNGGAGVKPFIRYSRDKNGYVRSDMKRTV